MAAVEQIPLARLRPIDLQRFVHTAPNRTTTKATIASQPTASVAAFPRDFRMCTNIPRDAQSTCLIDRRLDAPFGGHHVNHRRFHNIGNARVQSRDGDVHVSGCAGWMETLEHVFAQVESETCTIRHSTSNIEHRSKRMEKWLLFRRNQQFHTMS